MAELPELSRLGRATRRRSAGGLLAGRRLTPHPLTGADTKQIIKILLEIGFLEPIGESYKVPMLYRDGLGITQGKAFATPNPRNDDDEDD